MKQHNIKLPDGMALGEFKPVAYHDKDRDCLCVMLEDASVTEVELVDGITLHMKNHAGDPKNIVGLTVHGISELIRE